MKKAVIVDVTHGFRYLPILMIIDLIIQNIKQENKIKSILFAKELVKPLKENNFIGEYDIIDLRQYLGLANITYHILANSLQELKLISNNLYNNTEYIIKNLNNEEKMIFKVVERYLMELKEHMEYIKKISDIKEDCFSEKN